MGIVACIGTKADLFLLVFSHYTCAQSAVASLPCSRQKTDHTWLKAATQDVTQPTTCLVMKSFMVDLPFCLAMIPMIHMAAHCHMAFVNLCASSRPSRPTFGQVFCAPFMGKARWVIGWAMVGRAEFARGPQGYQADSNSMVTISLSVHFLTSSWQSASANIVARYLIAQMALSSGMMDEGFGA